MCLTVTEELVTCAVMCRVLCSVLLTEPMRETGNAKKKEPSATSSCSVGAAQHGHSSKETVLHVGAWGQRRCLCCQRQMRGSEKDVGEQSAWRSPSSVDNDWYNTGGTVPEELCFSLLQPGESCKALVWVFLLLLEISFSARRTYCSQVLLFSSSFQRRIFEGIEIPQQPFQRCWLWLESLRATPCGATAGRAEPMCSEPKCRGPCAALLVCYT